MSLFQPITTPREKTCILSSLIFLQNLPPASSSESSPALGLGPVCLKACKSLPKLDEHVNMDTTGDASRGTAFWKMGDHRQSLQPAEVTFRLCAYACMLAW